MERLKDNFKPVIDACRIAPIRNKNPISISWHYESKIDLLKHIVKVGLGLFLVYFGVRVVLIWFRIKEDTGFTGETPHDPWATQAPLSLSSLLPLAILGGFVLYIAYKYCNSPWHSHPYRAPGTRPKKDGEGFTATAYAADESYMPIQRASTAGPFPVSKRREREPTETFRSHLEPRRSEKSRGDDS